MTQSTSFSPVLARAAGVLFLSAALLAPASAQERKELGRMWTFEHAPLGWFQQAYDFTPTQEWLDKARLSSLRFGRMQGGDYRFFCSASFVSPYGLVMTNHHCARDAIVSVQGDADWLKDGYYAGDYAGEVKLPGFVMSQLLAQRDVTKEVAAEGEGAVLAKAKAAQPEYRHEVIALYQGGNYQLYTFKLYDDLRLVSAPHGQIAHYGGDLDNFTYPRWCLDCAFFRVYEDGKPVDSSKFYFKWNPEGAKADDLVFVSGHPGNTERLLTHAEMELHRDLSVPAIVRLLEQRAQMMKRRMDADKQAAFQLRDQYFGVMNSLKAYSGHLAGLRDVEMMTKMAARDAELVEKSGKPEVAAAFEFIAAEMQKLREAHGGEQVDLRKLMPAMQQVTMQTCADAKKTINDARFAVYGTALYPDATFTLRLAFGTVKGYEAGTTAVAPKTTLHGLYERNAAFDNAHPFDLPQRWLDKKGELNLNTAYNFVCTADIIGGNSGSPILNRAGEVVGLVFDGNIESLPGNYWFDERVNRCVGVHTAGMTEAMVKVYGEVELANELLGK